MATETIQKVSFEPTRLVTWLPHLQCLVIIRPLGCRYSANWPPFILAAHSYRNMGSACNSPPSNKHGTGLKGEKWEVSTPPPNTHKAGLLPSSCSLLATTKNQHLSNPEPATQAVKVEVYRYTTSCYVWTSRIWWCPYHKFSWNYWMKSETHHIIVMDFWWNAGQKVIEFELHHVVPPGDWFKIPTQTSL